MFYDFSQPDHLLSNVGSEIVPLVPTRLNGRLDAMAATTRLIASVLRLTRKNLIHLEFALPRLHVSFHLQNLMVESADFFPLHGSTPALPTRAFRLEGALAAAGSF